MPKLELKDIIDAGELVLPHYFTENK